MHRSISLRTFLESMHVRPDEALHGPTLIFSARTYPLLFFSLLLQKIRAYKDSHLTVIDLKAATKHEIQRTLQTSFLGLKTIFWLGSIAELSATEQQSWLSFLKNYKGPHTIIACVEVNEAMQAMAFAHIEISDGVSFDTIITVAALLLSPFDKEKLHYFFKKVTEITGALTLDQVCLLLMYSTIVAGKNNDQFCKELLPSIVQPHHSLFALSDALFEKNSKKFLSLWQSLNSQFSMQFWIAFWSEQLWRAYFYSVCMKSGRIADAKKISYKLPYSFTQKSWKSYTLEPFIKSHQALYELDYACKNGAVGQEAMLELICMKFMNQ